MKNNQKSTKLQLCVYVFRDNKREATLQVDN